MEKLKIEFEAQIIGSYDTIVCGGGTAGVVAALAAARNGAKTLLLESEYHLGGMLTMGNAGITKYVMHGSDTEEQKKINEELKTNPDGVQIVGGIPLELTHKLLKNGDATGNYGTGAAYVYPDPHAFKLLLFDELEKAGVEVLLHSKVVKVLKDGNRITGVVFDAKEGHLVAYGKYIIDATGDGDVAELSGVKYIIGASEKDEVVKEGLVEVGRVHLAGSMYRIGGVDFDAVMKFLKDNPKRFIPQQFGFMGWEEMIEAYDNGESIILNIDLEHARYFQVYNNPRSGIMVGCINASAEYEYCKCLNSEELTKVEHNVLKNCSKQLEEIKREIPGFENAYILDVPKAGIRETRHIEGEYVLDIFDIFNNTEFEDTVGFSSHPIDVNPKPKVCLDMVLPKRSWFRIPYRCLVAKGIDNLLMAGRHISATREAFGCTRPTICCMIMGEAVGTAAAQLSKTGVAAKDIDMPQLRETLRNNGVKC